ASISEDRMVFFTQQGDGPAVEQTRSTYRLAPEAGHRRLELDFGFRIQQTFTDRTQDDPAEKLPEKVVPVRFLAPYDLRGDTLRLCYRRADEGFPERVEDPPSPGHVLMVLRSVREGDAPWLVAHETGLSLAALVGSALVAWLVVRRWAGSANRAAL